MAQLSLRAVMYVPYEKHVSQSLYNGICKCVTPEPIFLSSDAKFPPLLALSRVDDLLLHMFWHLFRSLFPLLFLHLLLV